MERLKVMLPQWQAMSIMFAAASVLTVMSPVCQALSSHNVSSLYTYLLARLAEGSINVGESYSKWMSFLLALWIVPKCRLRIREVYTTVPLSHLADVLRHFASNG